MKNKLIVEDLFEIKKVMSQLNSGIITEGTAPLPPCVVNLSQSAGFIGRIINKLNYLGELNGEKYNIYCTNYTGNNWTGGDWFIGWGKKIVNGVEDGNSKIDLKMQCQEDNLIIKDNSGNLINLIGAQSGGNGGRGTGGTKPKFTWKNCEASGQFKLGCMGDTVKKVQACLGFTGAALDGKFGKQTQGMLVTKTSKNTFTAQDVAKICGANTTPAPQPQQSEPNPFEDSESAQSFGDQSQGATSQSAFVAGQ